MAGKLTSNSQGGGHHWPKQVADVAGAIRGPENDAYEMPWVKSAAAALAGRGDLECRRREVLLLLALVLLECGRCRQD
jgi:hypothetical protein